MYEIEKIEFFEAQDEAGEAHFIAKQIKKNINSSEAELKDFAILYRTNAQSRSLEEAMITHNIPYKIVGGVKFYDRKEIKDILAYYGPDIEKIAPGACVYDGSYGKAF